MGEECTAEITNRKGFHGEVSGNTRPQVLRDRTVIYLLPLLQALRLVGVLCVRPEAPPLSDKFPEYRD